jgi:ribose transport system permease protein
MNNQETTKKRFVLPITIKDILPVTGAVILLGALLSFASPVFLTSRNLINVLVQASTMGIVAAGMTFQLVSGHFDLSGEACVAITALIAADLVANYGWPPILGLLLAIVLGMVIGAFNGILVSRLNLNPFIATLAMMNILRGLTLVWSKGLTIYNIPHGFTMFGDTDIFGVVPAPIVITLVLFIICHIVLSRTVFGHEVCAVGGNREAARLAGISVKKIQMLVYILGGFTFAIAGIVCTGRVGAAYPAAATGLSLSAISGVVIGGVSLSGGRGSLMGTYIGVLLMAILANGINLLNVSPYWSQFVQGVVILIAIILDMIRLRIQVNRN